MYLSIGLQLAVDLYYFVSGILKQIFDITHLLSQEIKTVWILREKAQFKLLAKRG